MAPRTRQEAHPGRLPAVSGAGRALDEMHSPAGLMKLDAAVRFRSRRTGPEAAQGKQPADATPGRHRNRMKVCQAETARCWTTAILKTVGAVSVERVFARALRTSAASHGLAARPAKSQRWSPAPQPEARRDGVTGRWSWATVRDAAAPGVSTKRLDGSPDRLVSTRGRSCQLHRYLVITSISPLGRRSVVHGIHRPTEVPGEIRRLGVDLMRRRRRYSGGHHPAGIANWSVDELAA